MRVHRISRALGTLCVSGGGKMALSMILVLYGAKMALGMLLVLYVMTHATPV